MREKYFEDLGLDDGQDILSKFKINMDEILEESKSMKIKSKKMLKKMRKKIINNKEGAYDYGNSYTKK